MNAALLGNVYLFHDLEPSELAEVLKICRRESFPREKHIFLEGDLSDKFYIIEEGEVGISKYIPGVGEESLAVLEAGSYFGDMALIDGSPRSATAVTNAETICLVIAKSDIDALLARNKEIGNKLLTVFCRTLSARLRDTNEKIAHFITMTTGLGARA